MNTDDADVTDDAGDGQIAQKCDFLGYSHVPAGHEVVQLLLELRYIDLHAVLLVDQADFGAEVLKNDSVAETLQLKPGEAVLIGAAREINQMIGRLQKFLDDCQATGHVPETMG